MTNISETSRLSKLSNSERSRMRSELITLFRNQYPQCRRIKVKYGPDYRVWARAVCGSRRLYAVAYTFQALAERFALEYSLKAAI